jgi:hypothetical protein
LISKYAIGGAIADATGNGVGTVAISIVMVNFNVAVLAKPLNF